MEHIINCFKKYCDFSGRASRSEFWSFWLFCVLVRWLVTIVSIRCMMSSSEKFVWEDWIDWGGGIWDLIVLGPWLTVVSRRLHDLNRGWVDFFVYILLVFVPAQFVSLNLNNPSLGNYISTVIGVENMAFLFVCCVCFACLFGLFFLIQFCRMGTVGDNRFGEDPLAEEYEFSQHEIWEIEQRISQADDSGNEKQKNN